jgi:S1-C subfamily serine protease
VLNKRFIIVLVGIGTVAAVFFANLVPPNTAQVRAAAPPAVARGQQSPVAVSPPNRIRPTGVSPAAEQAGLGTVVAAVRPAVVNVSARPDGARHHLQPGAQMLNPFPGRTGWVGSGVIIDPRGYILTSGQVVGNQQTIRVTMFRGGQNSFLAMRVAVDPQSNLVLLKLPFGGGVPHVPLGDSTRVRTGDIVVAVGSPFGLAETVTQGIVSANRRSLVVEGRTFMDVIQTDASINQGNCGGPLVNIGAQVIGVNMAIYSTDSTFSGIGFAVASNRARELLTRAVGLGR